VKNLAKIFNKIRQKDLIFMINNDRMNLLIKSFFESPDHGRQAMQDATVIENICFIDYLENNCIPKAKELDNEQDMQYFTEYDIHFRMLTLEKIMHLDHFGVLISKATNHFYSMNKDIVVLVDFSEADFLLNSLAGQKFDVEIRDFTREEFVSMVEDMHRIGFRNVQFTDGRLKPLVIPRDTILKNEKTNNTHNPQLYIESLIFLQEAHKFRQDNKGLVVNTDSPIAKAVRGAKYLVPAIVQSRQGNQMQVKYPFLNTSVEGQKILPVLTDRKEYDYFMTTSVMKEYSSLPDNKKACIELPFEEVYRIFTTDDVFGVAVNPVGFNLVLNQQLMGVMAKDITLTNNPEVKVERNGEEVVFPEAQDELPKKHHTEQDTDDLRRKVLEHFISTQEDIIKKNSGINTSEAEEKVAKAQTKLEEFKKQLEELNE
jgi:hypothetical protein